MREFFDHQIQRFNTIRRFPWANPRAYADFLAQTYYYVCHTTRLLGLCASRTGVEREDLHHRFLRYAAQERSHQRLAERDLNQLGQSLVSLPERSTTAALYETQYFRAEYRAPTMVYGYMLALEGLSAVYGSHVYEAVVASHGEACAAFVKLHAKADPDHLDNALSAVEHLPTRELDLIQQNFSFTADLHLALLQDIEQHATP